MIPPPVTPAVCRCAACASRTRTPRTRNVLKEQQALRDPPRGESSGVRRNSSLEPSFRLTQWIRLTPEEPPPGSSAHQPPRQSTPGTPVHHARSPEDTSPVRTRRNRWGVDNDTAARPHSHVVRLLPPSRFQPAGLDPQWCLLHGVPLPLLRCGVALASCSAMRPVLLLACRNAPQRSLHAVVTLTRQARLRQSRKLLLQPRECDAGVAFRRSRNRKEVIDHAEIHDHESLRR